MSVASVPFLLAAVLTVLALQFERLRRRRREVATFASVLFCAAVTDTLGSALSLMAVATSGWLLVRAVARCKDRRLLAGAVACIVVEFLVVRQVLPTASQATTLQVGQTVGLSYLMFRIIHLIVDAHGDELPADIRLGDYILYLFSFLTFLAGPIQRFQDFAEELNRPAKPVIRADLPKHLSAIIAGYFRLVVVAALFFGCFAWSQDAGVAQADEVKRSVALLSFAAYLYSSFSGYMGVVRGVGGLMDIRLPPNFDHPLATANFLDLWSRWHITLSDWFKLYVFNPVVKELLGLAKRPRLAPYLGALGYFLAFLLMGVWHGPTARFALYGLCLGAGVSVNKLFQTWMMQRLGRPAYAKLSKHAGYAAVARSLALTYFVLALGFLWIPGHAEPDGWLADWATPAMLVFAVFLLALSADRMFAAAPVRRLCQALAQRDQGAALLRAGQLAAVLICLLLWPDAVPPLLYQFF